jgi:AraC-like DNA-binding protein
VKPPLHRVEHHRSAVRGIEAMTLTSERAFPRHAHDELGIGIVHAGAQRSWSVVGDVEAMAGDVIMVNPGELHDGLPIGGARRWTIVYFDPGRIAGALAEEGTHDWTVRPVARDRRLAASVRRLLDTLWSQPLDGAALDDCLIDCLSRVHDRHEVRGPRRDSLTPPVARALERIKASPQASVSLAELALECGVTRFQLLRGFARDVGTTPHAYQLARRASLARRHLRAGMAVAEAAALAGFSDQSHLTRVFLRHFGVTPGRFRLQALR